METLFNRPIRPVQCQGLIRAPFDKSIFLRERERKRERERYIPEGSRRIPKILEAFKIVENISALQG